MKGRARIPDPYGSKALWFLPHQAASRGLYSKNSPRQTSLASPLSSGYQFLLEVGWSLQICARGLERLGLMGASLGRIYGWGIE